MALSVVAIVILTSIVVYSADAAGIPKKAISTVSRFIESDLPTTTLFTDVQNTITSIQQFTTTSAVFENPAKTFGTTLAGGAVTANRTLNIPVITGTDTLATLGLVQTFTGAQTINSLILGGDVNVGSNGLTTSGHKGTLPANTGTFLYTNGSFTGTQSSGSISPGVTITSLSNAGHVSTFPSNTGTLLQVNGSGSSLTGIVTSATGTANNVTVSASTGAVTWNLGSNVVTTGGSAQRFTKILTIPDPTLNGVGLAYLAKTASYSATANDIVIGVDATNTNPTVITLPSASTNVNNTYWIKKTDYSKNPVKIIGTSSQTIDGFFSYNMTYPMQTVGLISDGSNWENIRFPTTYIL